MAESKPDETVGQADGEQKAPTTEQPKTSKTMQELERLQFDALDRAGFEKS